VSIDDRPEVLFPGTNVFWTGIPHIIFGMIFASSQPGLRPAAAKFLGTTCNDLGSHECNILATSKVSQSTMRARTKTRFTRPTRWFLAGPSVNPFVAAVWTLSNARACSRANQSKTSEFARTVMKGLK